MHDKHKIWLPPGGHVELDEDPNAAAIREAKEEVGLDVVLLGDAPNLEPNIPGYKELIPPMRMNIHKISKTHRHISHVYYALTRTHEVKPSGDDRSDEWHWFTREELIQEAAGRGSRGVRQSICFYGLEALDKAEEFFHCQQLL